MNTLSGFRAICACAALVSVAEAADLHIEITDIEQVEGTIMLAMYDSAEGFDEGKAAPVAATGIKVTAETVSLSMDDLPPGTYAIKLYHDANDNGEMDTNMMGLPVEGYGFSRNGGRFGPPAFEDAAFVVAEGDTTHISIQLR